MLNTKKIVSSVFPKMQELPKAVIEHYGRKESDGAIIFSPNRYGNEPSAYFCTKCGTKGETTDEAPVCSNCGNTAFRAPMNSGRHTDDCKSIRFIQQVDGIVVIRDYDCFPKESASEGIVPTAEEFCRIALSDSDYGLYGEAQRYERPGVKKYWASTKEVYHGHEKTVNLVVSDEGVYENPLMKKLADDLTLPIDELADRVKLAAVGEVESKGNMPEVSFEPFDESKITGVQERWHVEVHKQVVDNTDSYTRVLSWCTSCGKFSTRLVEEARSYSAEGCKHCGNRNNYYGRDKEYIFYVVDANMDITTVLKTIQGYGVDILSEEKRALGYITDLIPGDTKTQRRIRSLYESGAVKLLSKERATNKDTLFLKAVSCLSGYADYEQDLSEELIGCFFKALDWKYTVPNYPQETSKNPPANSQLQHSESAQPSADRSRSFEESNQQNNGSTPKVKKSIETPVISKINKIAPPIDNLPSALEKKPSNYSDPKQSSSDNKQQVSPSIDLSKIVKDEIKIKRDVFSFVFMMLSFIVFGLAVFLGITILAELTYSENINNYVMTALQYLSLDNVYTIIYITGALGLLFI